MQGFTGVRCGYCGCFLGTPKKCPTCNGMGVPSREVFGREHREDWIAEHRPKHLERYS